MNIQAEKNGLNGLLKKMGRKVGTGWILEDLGGGMGCKNVKERSFFINFSLLERTPPFNTMLHGLHSV